ncbi:hypothetical protein ABB37_08066 [Leptomonas pyrrhocoris]|uniref:Uncharacterized protein n=1 Tax=Leptomonas pyrrhocoris TaxID=157538 RepID=A0A0M9FTT1_LEPPY|nr:hypothetical protein ABB37_08066 [Leptomonas pyrrhocoris]KPA75883.1 hypothetical protein ABB37_08066 [Leptomonas pyrrhocoris]|eukprot:XP_015654322.1 hypothetical protein ABB37_08066 [Leptomonas pyrrhocoris]
MIVRVTHARTRRQVLQLHTRDRTQVNISNASSVGHAESGIRAGAEQAPLVFAFSAALSPCRCSCWLLFLFQSLLVGLRERKQSQRRMSGVLAWSLLLPSLIIAIRLSSSLFSPSFWNSTTYAYVFFSPLPSVSISSKNKTPFFFH